MAFRVLVVCTANICRSPLAEHLLRSALEPLATDWEVLSAGTRAVSGTPVHPQIAGILRGRGIDTEGWTSTRLTVADIDAADLVLTAEATHRAAVVVARPSALQRSFTLRQFAGLCASVPAVDAGDSAGPDLLERARLARSAVPVARSEEDIADPMGGRRRLFDRTARLVDDAITEIVRPLTARAAGT